MKRLLSLITMSTIIAASCDKQPKYESPTSKTALILDVYYGEMRETMANDYPKYLSTMKELAALNKNNPFFQYHLGRAHYLASNSNEGFNAIKKHVSQIQAIEYVVSDSLLAANIESDQITQLQSLYSNNKPEKTEQVAFEVPQQGFTAEGLAVNPISKSIYLGSIRLGKIIKIDSSGKIVDFINEHQFGIKNILGMEIDQQGEYLYACGEYTDPATLQLKSGVFKFNLTDGQLKHRFFPNDTLGHEFNDLTIVNNEVYVTDSKSGGLYKIKNDQISLFIDQNKLSLTNGIAKTPDGRFLYIADMFFGVMKYDLEANQYKWIKMPDNFTLTSIDGLTYYEGGLIAHQFTLNGVYYYTIENDSVIQKSTISYAHPLLKDHTTGDMLGGTYYFIANSDIDILNRYGNDVSVDSLNNTIILKQEL
ncbi:SMP-30/gluconolactonase/LRE family protein [Fulvivirga lutimaris]|uniref:SMP-30/gluconolactonase/LRE family protein n=1 Tax=Fulvivirga lutimaris TaxID=1819566 RepID=UPI0012BD7BDA|nr:SMP-30/gluconolactonase/LRE family protein [Fulvivirga lutimaris]MTI39862.1 hypothetical protein [Fulvivirga lutimaris]